MSGRGCSRVPIPSNVKKTIQNIREITGQQHSDDEIYAVLKECSMDPNETADKVLHLDTFHEVKHKKRDRRKENLNSRGYEGSRIRSSMQGRLVRADGSGKNAAPQRGNGSNHMAERVSMHFSVSVSQKTKSHATPHVIKGSTAPANGHMCLSNGSSSYGHTKLLSAVSGINVWDDSLTQKVNNMGTTLSQPAISSAFTPSLGGQGKFNSSLEQLSDSLTPVSVLSVSSVSDPVLEKSLSQHFGDLESSTSDKAFSGSSVSPNHQKSIPIISKEVEKNQPSKPSLLSTDNDSLEVMTSSNGDNQVQQEPIVPLKDVSIESPTVTVEVSPSELHVSDGQYVIFPKHFQVPEYLRNRLTFGSIEADIGLKIEPVKGSGDVGNGVTVVEQAEERDETAKEYSPCQTSVSTTQVDNPDQQGYDLDGNVSSNTGLKNEQSKEILVPSEDGSKNSNDHNTPAYNLSLVSPMFGTQRVQSEDPKPKAIETPAVSNIILVMLLFCLAEHKLHLWTVLYMCLLFLFTGNFIHLTSSPTAITSPFYVSPIHQYLSPNGFPQQPTSGNVYLPSAPATSAGIKFSFPQFKPGSATNPTHIGFPTGGSYIPTPVCYAPGPTVTYGSSACNDDIVASQLKENHIYTTRQLSEGSAVWINGAGQDMPSLQVNSLCSLAPQRQHVTFPPAQAGPGAFAGIYQSGPTVSAPSSLMQQSEAVVGVSETVGPPSGSYQQPSHAQINWNANY